MNKDIYLFISSTFIDMESERDLLMLEVIPKVKKYCREKGLFLYPIDLRWGITEEQSKELNQTLRICLERVRDSKPLFLSFIGQRYGWVPTDEYLKDSIFDGCREKIKGLSATELEISEALNGIIFNSEKKETLFYLRDPSYLDEINSKKEKAKYLDDNNSSKESISKLYKKLNDENNGKIYKAEFDNSKNKLTNFTSNGERLEDVIYNDLIRKIDSLYPDEHIEERYYGQLSNEALYYNALHSIELIDVDDLVEKGPKEILLIGDFGVGKTCVFASILKKFKEKYESEKHLILYRFENISYYGDVRRFLHSLIEELNNIRKTEFAPFDPLKTMVHYFYEVNCLINSMVEDGYVIDLFVDEGDEEFIDVVLALQGINRCVIASSFADVVNSKKYKSTIDFDELFKKQYSKIITYQFNEIGKNLSPKQCEAFKNEEDMFSLMSKITYLKRFTSRKTIDSDIKKLIKTEFFEVYQKYVKKLREHLNDEENECFTITLLFFCLFLMVKETVVVSYLNHYFKKDISVTFYKLMLYLQDFIQEVNGIYTCNNYAFIGSQVEILKTRFNAFTFLYNDFVDFYIKNCDDDKAAKLYYSKAYMLQISSFGFCDLTIRSFVKHYDVLVDYIKEFGLSLFLIDCTRIFKLYKTVEPYFKYKRDETIINDLNDFVIYLMDNFTGMQHFPEKLGLYINMYPNSYISKNIDPKFNVEPHGLTVKDKKYEFLVGVETSQTSFGFSHDYFLIPGKDNLLYCFKLSTMTFQNVIGFKEKIMNQFSYAASKETISFINGLGEYIRYSFVTGEVVKSRVKVDLSTILVGDCSFSDCFSYVDKNKVVHVLFFTGEEKTFSLKNVGEIYRLIEFVYNDSIKVVLVTDRGIKELFFKTNVIDEYNYELPVYPKAVSFDEQGITRIVSCGNIYALFNGTKYVINSTIRIKSTTPFVFYKERVFFIGEDNSILCDGKRIENEKGFEFISITRCSSGYLLLDKDGRLFFLIFENNVPELKLF